MWHELDTDKIRRVGWIGVPESEVPPTGTQLVFKLREKTRGGIYGRDENRLVIGAFLGRGMSPEYAFSGADLDQIVAWGEVR